MAAPVKNPEVLNELLKEILVGLVDQAHGEYEGRTGRIVKLDRLQSMKMKTVATAVKMAMKPLARFGDPQKKFDRFASLSNEWLPKIVDIVGEDRVIDRIDNLPEKVRNRDIIRTLDEAGATELALLMGKAIPGWEAERKANLLPHPVPAVAPAIKPAPESQLVLPPTVSDAFSEVVTARPEVTAPVEDAAVPDMLGMMKKQLIMMDAMRGQLDKASADLRQAIQAAERSARPAPKP